MSTPRDIRLSPEDLALKLAFHEAVLAAGGQKFVERETGKAQSRISDYGSPNTADFAPVDVIRKVEALGAGAPGHPHVTRALARASGAVLSGALPIAAGLEDLGDHLAAVTRETADLTAALAEEDLAGDCRRLSTAARQRILHEGADLVAQVEQLLRAVGGQGDVVDFERPGRRSDSS
jgi:hypothetical protein